MKKQAAVQCLRSASDEVGPGAGFRGRAGSGWVWTRIRLVSSVLQNSGIENLVEELCSRLKDIQTKQKGELPPYLLLHPPPSLSGRPGNPNPGVSAEEKPVRRKSPGGRSPEPAASPSSKDQVEM